MTDWHNALDFMSEDQRSNRFALAQLESAEIAMAECLRRLDKALGNRRGIRRYGCATIPMDDALSRVVVDLGGRPYLVYEIANKRRKIMAFDVSLIEEFLRAFCVQARMNLHVAQLYGREPHHAYESVFKALARALREAVERDPREQGIPSSKGTL